MIALAIISCGCLLVQGAAIRQSYSTLHDYEVCRVMLAKDNHTSRSALWLKWQGKRVNESVDLDSVSDSISAGTICLPNRIKDREQRQYMGDRAACGW